MFEITKEFRFEAAHKLPLHDGKCARLHGHSWRGRLVLRAAMPIQCGPKTGMVQDFGDVSKVLAPFVEEHLDHHYLNETTDTVQPTSELLAEWVFNELKPKLPLLVAVEIDETCTSSARYEP